MSEATDDAARTPDGGSDAGTQDEAARNAEAEANKGKLIASLQEKAARLKDAEARALAAEAQVAALTRPASSPAASGNGGDEREQRIAEAREWAEGRRDPKGNKDPVAGVVLDVLDELRMTQAELQNLRKLDRITDETKRDKVQKHFDANRHRLGDIDAAQAEIERVELADTLKARDAELEKLRKEFALSASKRDPNVIATVDREVTAAEHKEREMTGAEWNDRQAELTRMRDAGDANADRVLRMEQLARRSGSIKVKD